jgi:hypothetical protein
MKIILGEKFSQQAVSALALSVTAKRELFVPLPDLSVESQSPCILHPFRACVLEPHGLPVARASLPQIVAKALQEKFGNLHQILIS